MDWYPSDSDTASMTVPYKLAPFARLRDRPNRAVTVMTHVSLLALVFASIFGIILSGIVFSPLTMVVDGECLGQSFVLFASLLALLYIGLHVSAAKQNYSVVRSQPFQHPLHSWTIIAVRLDLATWSVALLTTAIGVGKAPVRVVMLDLDLFVSCVGFIFAICALCIVERAEQPYNVPGLSIGNPILAPGTKFTCRLSQLDLSSEDSSSRHSRPWTGDGRRTPLGPRPLTPARPRTMAGDAEAARLRADSTPRTPEREKERELRAPRKISSKATLRGPDESPRGPRQQPIYPTQVHQRPGTGRSWQSDWSTLKAEAGIHSTTTSRANSLHGASPQEPEMMEPVPPIDQRWVPSVLIPGSGGRSGVIPSMKLVSAHRHSKTSPHVRVPLPGQDGTRGHARRATDSANAPGCSEKASGDAPGQAGHHDGVAEPDPARWSFTWRIPGAFAEE